MDAFFAAVEEREHEWLREKPIVVGADPENGRGRGGVSTANYKAREYGIHSAIPISKAWELSQAAKKQGKEPAVFLLGDHRLYAEASQRIMNILAQFSNTIEQASIDEAYFEIDAPSWAAARLIAETIKSEIRARERLSSSIGIGPNKLIAKIASDFKKPDGLTVVTDEEKGAFLAPLPIRKIPGIGPKTERLFTQMNVRLVGDLMRYDEPGLKNLMGKWGSELYQKIRGRDDSEIETSYESKSIGEQETFLHDTSDPQIILGKISEMSRAISDRMTREGFSGFRTVAIIIRFEGFETYTRAHTLPLYSSSKDILQFEALKLAMPFLDGRENPKNKKIRLVGVRIEKIVRRKPHQPAISA